VSDWPEKVREHRDDLEALAESDLRCSKYATALLDTLEDTDAGAHG
jgi:hypothetical protein